MTTDETQQKLIRARLEKCAKSVGIELDKYEAALMSLAELTFSDREISLDDICDSDTQALCVELAERSPSDYWYLVLFSLGTACLSEKPCYRFFADEGEWPEGIEGETRRLIDYSFCTGLAASKCADFLNPAFDANPAVVLANKRHRETREIAEYVRRYWRENISPMLSAQKAAEEVVRANLVPIGFRKIAQIISEEKKKPRE